MKKQVFGRKLSRTKNQRKALFRGLSASLIKEGEITTTLAKAKAIRGQVEKLVTKAKSGTLGDRRIVLRFLPQKSLVNRLFAEIAPLFRERKGGYLRLIRVGERNGDGSPMAKLIFTERVGKMVPVKKEEKKDDKSN